MLQILDLEQIHDLVESKIELLSDYKLEYPRDYEAADIDAMHDEIARLKRLQDRLAGITPDTTTKPRSK